MKIGNYKLPSGQYCNNCQMKNVYKDDMEGEITYCWLWEKRLSYINKYLESNIIKTDECLNIEEINIKYKGVE